MRQRSSSSSSHAAFAAVSLLSVIVILSCSFFSRTLSPVPETGGAANQETEISGEETPVTQAGQAEPERVLESALPRSFKYKNLTFTLQKAVITSEPPEGADFSENEASYAETVWQVSNPTTEFVNISQGVFTLTLGNGTTANRAYDDQFASQDTREVRVIFNLPPKSTWDNAQIVFSEPDKEPAVLPLQGEVPASIYPQTLTNGGEAEVKAPAVLLYKIQESSVDLDGFAERADKGKIFVIFKLETTCKEPQYDCYVGPESFRIIADGTPYSAQRLDPAAEAVHADSSQVFRMAFQIPSNAAQVELQVGEGGKETAKIPISWEAGQ